MACGCWEISQKDGVSLENPILLFEVLSRSTCNYYRGAKLFYYCQIASLTDVLLIDQPTHLVEHHHRGPRGWRTVTRQRGNLPLLGGSLSLAALYEAAEGLPEDD